MTDKEFTEAETAWMLYYQKREQLLPWWVRLLEIVYTPSSYKAIQQELLQEEVRLIEKYPMYYQWREERDNRAW